MVIVIATLGAAGYIYNKYYKYSTKEVKQSKE